MATVEVTEQNFEAVTRTGVVLLDWWAEWCGPCRAFAPIYQAAADRHPEVVFGKVDTDVEATLAGSFGITAIPTLMIFRDGLLVFERAGVVSGSALDQLIGKVKELDLDEVRRSLGTTADTQGEAGR